MAESVDPILQAAIDRGNALPTISAGWDGHLFCDDIGEAASNPTQPGAYGTNFTYVSPEMSETESEMED